jgi:hypothetical protein
MSALAIGLAIPWALLSIPLMYFLPRIWRAEARLARDGLVVPGTVIEEVFATEGFDYVVRYTVAGRSYELRTETSSLSVGQVVAVRYLPGAPEEGRVDTAKEVRHGTGAILFGILFLWFLSAVALFLGWIQVL